MHFEEGAVVKLNSGGPKMTVEGYEEGLVVCVWFEGTDRKRELFKEATMSRWVRAEPPRMQPIRRTRFG